MSGSRAEATHEREPRPRGGAAVQSTGSEPSHPVRGRVVIITGLSGAGKSQAAKLFEDLGYYCVDNMPPELLDGFLALRTDGDDRYRNVALVLDIRAGDPAPAILRARAALDDHGEAMQVIYLEASDAILVSRFSETRHRHPLQERGGVQGGIREERRRLARARDLADEVLDTTGFSIGQLKERLFAMVPTEAGVGELQIDVITFGFKYGIPLDADLVFDVRFLTNPYWIPDLKPLSGLTDPVRDFVLAQPAAGRFLELVQELLELTTPAYRSEGKSRLAVALGCTGGYHRSIALAEELARRLRDTGEGAVTVFHRELDR
ncbi:MAG: RNase adapter RapZ [Chloroflexota bacterium]